MTLNGTVHRTFFLLCLVVASASTVWGLLYTQPELVYPLMLVGVFGGFICSLIAIFKKPWAAVAGSAYALFEGLAIGGISAVANLAYPGVVPQAVALTFGTLFALLFLYRSGMVKATENFKLGLLAAMGGILLVSLGSLLMMAFGMKLPAIYGNGGIGIAFSLIVTAVAALNLVLDFDFIEKGVEYGAPKYMEWYAAFGLMVTLIWLYMEILRLLVKLRSRD